MTALSPEQALIRGWNVIPARTDKRPAIPSWKPFQRQRVTITQIHEWTSKLRPKAWAVITGAISGVIVLDFDGAAGNETLKRLGFSPHVRTGTGGHHVYIQHPGFRVPTLNSKTKEQLGLRFPGLDIRGDGGYAMFAGANNDGPYEWLRPPDPYTFSSLPAELREFLPRVREKSEQLDGISKVPKPSTGRVPSKRLLGQALERVATDGRNNAGFGLAVQLRDNGYLEIEAEQIMLEYAARVPSVNAKGHPESYFAAEARASLRQAYSRPARVPWTTDRDRNLQDGGQFRIERPDLLSFLHNDHGNAQRLVTLYDQDMRYCHAMRRWLIWDGRRWKADETEQARKLATETALQFLEQAVRGNSTDAVKFAKLSLDHRRITTMLASAACLLPITPPELDTDIYLLNVLNGTLDLRSGQLREHRRDDYITKRVHFEYKPRTQCPLFLQFLHRIMGDGPDASDADGERAERLVAHLQKVFGYSLTGDVAEKVIFCFFGNGNNGKTTLLEAIRFVLWEYAAQVLIDTLMVHQQRESNASLADLADLRGVRFVTTSEAEEGQRLAEGKLKYLSAGMGEIKTCRKYENPIKFLATHKLFLDANHRPIVRGADRAIWNRLKPIPFIVTISDNEIDKGMLDKLKTEAEGILAWMVEGCRRWMAEGLGDPPEIKEASADWRQDMDPLKDFIVDRCELSPDAYCTVSELRQAYADWAQENGEKPVWGRVFRDHLLSIGCTQSKIKLTGKQVRVWRGIALINEHEAEG